MPEPQRCPVARLTWAGWIIKAKAYMRRKVKQCYCTRCQLWVWPDERCDRFAQGAAPRPKKRVDYTMSRRTH